MNERLHPTPTLEEAYTLHHKRVWKICYMMLHRQEDADDMVQDVFIHLATRLHHFRGEALFTTWLHRVTVNLTLMRIRKTKYRSRFEAASLDALAADEGTISYLEKILHFDDKQLLASVDRTVIQKALVDMPAGYRLALELDLQGFSTEEVAELTVTSIGSAKSQLFRAKTWLASKVGSTHNREVVEGLLDDFSQYLT